MTDPTTPEPEPTGAPKPKTKLGPVGVIIVILVVLCCGYGLFKSAAKGDDKPSSYEAKAMCEKFVEDRLKAPSTADYSGETATESGGTWTVTGRVDSENSFGAKIRSSFTCKMTVSGDTWRLVGPVTIA